MASQFFLWPLRKSLKFTIKGLQPRPGEGKDDGSITQTWPIRLFRIVLGVILTIASIGIAILTGIFHLAAFFGYKSRPAMGYIRPDESTGTVTLPKLTEDDPLTVCSYNIAMMFSIIGVGNDTREPVVRAEEIANDFLSDSSEKGSADVICFQEAFHQDAMEVLLEKLKVKYPYILYNIAPTAIGISSGLAIVSKYPINSAQFMCFKNSVGEDGLAPKGFLHCNIAGVDIYNTHFQAKPGTTEAAVRDKQLTQIENRMNQDKGCEQVLVGDFNASKINMWGVSNLDVNQPDKPVLDHIDKSFVEPFYQDHNDKGVRISGQSFYEERDKKRTKFNACKEPQGTWSKGAHANVNNAISSTPLKKFNDAAKAGKYHVFDKDTPPTEEVSWGTEKWESERPVTNALLDHVLIPKSSSITAKVEVRNPLVPKGAQSYSSDHLPMYARMFKKAPPVEVTASDVVTLKPTAK